MSRSTKKKNKRFLDQIARLGRKAEEVHGPGYDPKFYTAATFKLNNGIPELQYFQVNPPKTMTICLDVELPQLSTTTPETVSLAGTVQVLYHGETVELVNFDNIEIVPGSVHFVALLYSRLNSLGTMTSLRIDFPTRLFVDSMTKGVPIDRDFILSTELDGFQLHLKTLLENILRDKLNDECFIPKKGYPFQATLHESDLVQLDLAFQKEYSISLKTLIKKGKILI